jgi:hypothetical protein
MTAAKLTSKRAGTVAPHQTSTGRGYKCVVHTVTLVTTLDWVELSEFTRIEAAIVLAMDTTNSNNLFPIKSRIDTTTPWKIIIPTAGGTAATPVKIIAWGY